MKKRTGRVSRWLACCCLLLAATPLLAGKKEKKPAAGASVSQAILGGTVFNGAGFAMRGAEVTITREGAQGKERWKAVSDARGEFFLRLPPGPAKYNVSVRVPGVRPQEKQMTFEADERLELNFVLEPAAGGGK